MNGLVTFRLGQREYATALAAVREVVRLEGLADLPGMAPPLAGVLDLRGTALPVLDLRTAVRDRPRRRGDVLVLAPPAGGSSVGVAVDQVLAVLAGDELPRAGDELPRAGDELPRAGDELPRAGSRAGHGDVLPVYVLDVLRGPGGVVFLVDLAAMVDAAREPVVVRAG